MMSGPLQTLPVLLTAVIILNCFYSTASASPSSRGSPETPLYSQGLPPHDQPFRVVWDHPDPCERRGHPLNLSDYGIIHNTGRRFIGDEIQTLYNTGSWPAYFRNRSINGGLPQLVDDTTFATLRAAVGRYRVANFKGLGVLDFQSWRPTLYTNFSSLSVYQTESRFLVRLRHPEYNKTMVEKLAQAEWNAAARRIMSAKLAVAQKLMPAGHWGYYMYPRAWSGPGPNNKVEWLWRQATGLYPSIYLTNPNQTTAHKQSRVKREIAEAVRIQNTFSPPKTPIYPYSNIQQGANIFFQQDHLRVTLGLPADMGASGIVLWGSSGYYRARGQCQRLQQHVRQVLGPYVRNLTQFMSDCSAALCAGHARCVNNGQDVLLNVSVALSLSAQCTSRDSRFHDYHCRCYSPWTGACCQTYTPSPCQPSEAVASSKNERTSRSHEHHGVAKRVPVHYEPKGVLKHTPARKRETASGGQEHPDAGNQNPLPQYSQGLPPPDKPFRVVWNHPDPCEKNGHSLNLSDYGIIHNTGRGVIGDEIQLLYNIGRWPLLKHSQSVNGGIPQRANLTFADLRTELNKHRVDIFSGLGILDFLGWRPIFFKNFGVYTKYKTESMKWVRQRHPDYNSSMVYKLAEAEWQEGARKVMAGKLAVAQNLMPAGHWGYYAQPRAYSGNSSEGQNNKIAWLWRQATGLYPRFYLRNLRSASLELKRRWVTKEMTEALRIQNTFSPPNTAIYTFSNFEDGPYTFLRQDHLDVNLGIPAAMGASGVVLWGSSELYRHHGQCRRVHQYVRQVLGPYVRNLTQFMSDCSAALCAGHGRCVNNGQDVLLNVSVALSLSAQCTSRDSRFHDYHCRCYSPWTGACCQTYDPLLCQPAQAAASSQKERASGGTMA